MLKPPPAPLKLEVFADGELIVDLRNTVFDWARSHRG